jgi:hypothetical protein
MIHKVEIERDVRQIARLKVEAETQEQAEHLAGQFIAEEMRAWLFDGKQETTRWDRKKDWDGCLIINGQHYNAVLDGFIDFDQEPGPTMRLVTDEPEQEQPQDDPYMAIIDYVADRMSGGGQ